MIYFNGYNRILSKYYEKENFIHLAKKNIFESIQEISNKTIRNQVEKNGLDKLHHFFSLSRNPRQKSQSLSRNRFCHQFRIRNHIF